MAISVGHSAPITNPKPSRDPLSPRLLPPTHYIPSVPLVWSSSPRPQADGHSCHRRLRVAAGGKVPGGFPEPLEVGRRKGGSKTRYHQLSDRRLAG